MRTDFSGAIPTVSTSTVISGPPPAQFPWLVRCYGSEIAGDRVYIWRTGGSRRGIAGVIAESEVIAAAEPRTESVDAIPFWNAGAEEASTLFPHAILRLVRVARAREVIRREWCVEDPVLRDLLNLKVATGTNYPLSPEQAQRLAALWSRTGHDWSRDEAVAGLWAYARTHGGRFAPARQSRLNSRAFARASSWWRLQQGHELVTSTRARRGRACQAAAERMLWCGRNSTVASTHHCASTLLKPSSHGYGAAGSRSPE
jgi:hypothetical protein